MEKVFRIKWEESKDFSLDEEVLESILKKDTDLMGDNKIFEVTEIP